MNGAYLALGNLDLARDAFEVLAQVVARSCPVKVPETGPIVARANQMEVLRVVPRHLIEDHIAVDGSQAEISQRLSLELLRLHLFSHELCKSAHGPLRNRGHMLQLLVTPADHSVEPNAILLHLQTLLASTLGILMTVDSLEFRLTFPELLAHIGPAHLW